ncbi:Adenosinetriphosphatase/Nucleoside-triphosphate phosphatase, partial [Scytalidium lignicola]
MKINYWYDEATKKIRRYPRLFDPSVERRKNAQTVEERAFQTALISLQGYFEKLPGFGPLAMIQAKKIVTNTMDMSLSKATVRECLAKNVDIWMRLQIIFNLAMPTLANRSLPPSCTNAVPSNDPESAMLILKNYMDLIQDLTLLNHLMVISRNMLAIKEVAQELCAAVQFNKVVNRLILLCVNVTSKGYDGENVDEKSRVRLNEVTEMYKRLLVTCLQHTHNWTMGNDRFKMSFWFHMFFDNELNLDMSYDPPDGFRDHIAYEEVRNWLRRHNKRDSKAAQILEQYNNDVPLGYTPGPLPIDDDFTDGEAGEEKPELRPEQEEVKNPAWREDITDKYEQDRLYGRVSHEIDTWWRRCRDANYEKWVSPMETVDGAIARTQASKDNAIHRYVPRNHDSDDYGPDGLEDRHEDHVHGEDTVDTRSIGEAGEEEEEEDEEEDEEDEEDDDDSYVEGPLRGLLTEIPNILDTKQIEALHMTVKACIVDSMGSGLTPAGENLQKTRCKMFLALDCGKNLLRELLVFIAVWEQSEQQFIFQITAQIIESFHHNALLPYAWNSLRIMKDIVSPAQTVLLRLINYMFRARKDTPIYEDQRDFNRDHRLVHFLYKYFRCRVVPDCVALLYVQALIRTGKLHPNDFPVDLWDMERAKDGLSQYLDFISVIAEIDEMRPLLIEWEAVYELVTLLKALEAGVPRKPLVDPPPAAPARGAANVGSGSSTPVVERPYDAQPGDTHPHGDGAAPNLPPLHDTPHKFPWSGIKVQILIVLTSLVAPSNPRRQGPGNPVVQKQILERGGMMPLLNCCIYDGHHEYLKERVTLAMKYIMEGCEEAQNFIKDLVPPEHLGKHPNRQALQATKTANSPSAFEQSKGAAESSSSKVPDPAPGQSREDYIKELESIATSVQTLENGDKIMEINGELITMFAKPKKSKQQVKNTVRDVIAAQKQKTGNDKAEFEVAAIIPPEQSINQAGSDGKRKNNTSGPSSTIPDQSHSLLKLESLQKEMEEMAASSPTTAKAIQQELGSIKNQVDALKTSIKAKEYFDKLKQEMGGNLVDKKVQKGETAVSSTDDNVKQTEIPSNGAETNAEVTSS